MNKKILLAASILSSASILSICSVIFTHPNRNIASDEYSRTFTFDKNVTLESLDEDGYYVFMGQIVTNEKSKHFIEYDLSGYGDKLTTGGDAFFAGSGSYGRLSFQGDLYINGLTSVSINVSVYDAYYDGNFDLRARKVEVVDGKNSVKEEEIVNVGKVGTTSYEFDASKGFNTLYINAYALNKLTIDSLTVTYDCANFYN